MNYWVTIYRVAFGAVIVLVTIAIISAFVPKLRKHHEEYRKRTEFQQENRILAEQVKVLRNKQERFTRDPNYVERTAREIGMVKPDEMVFKYTNDEANSGKDNR